MLVLLSYQGWLLHSEDSLHDESVPRVGADEVVIPSFFRDFEVEGVFHARTNLWGGGEQLRYFREEVFFHAGSSHAHRCSDHSLAGIGGDDGQVVHHAGGVVVDQNDGEFFASLCLEAVRVELQTRQNSDLDSTCLGKTIGYRIDRFLAEIGESFALRFRDIHESFLAGVFAESLEAISTFEGQRFSKPLEVFLVQLRCPTFLNLAQQVGIPDLLSLVSGPLGVGYRRTITT